MTIEAVSHFGKPIAAVAAAGITYLADSITPDIPGVPAWLTSLGLPLAFLVCVIYALVSIHKALRDSEKGRREDLKAHAEKLDILFEKSNETRERLIQSMDRQTNEFSRLVDHVKDRPCQR